MGPPARTVPTTGPTSDPHHRPTDEWGCWGRTIQDVLARLPLRTR